MHARHEGDADRIAEEQRQDEVEPSKVGDLRREWGADEL